MSKKTDRLALFFACGLAVTMPALAEGRDASARNLPVQATVELQAGYAFLTKYQQFRNLAECVERAKHSRAVGDYTVLSVDCLDPRTGMGIGVTWGKTPDGTSYPMVGHYKLSEIGAP